MLTYICKHYDRNLTAIQPTRQLVVEHPDVFGFEQPLQVSVAEIPCKQQEQAAEVTSQYCAFGVDLYT